MKNKLAKFTNALLVIFTIAFIIFAPMFNYLKNNSSNIALLNNKVFIITLLVLGCILALTGLMLILTGLCYIRNSLSTKQNFKFKKKQVIAGLIIIGIIAIIVVGNFSHKENSQVDKNTTSQVATQNDNSSTSTDQDNDTTSESDNNTSVNTSTQTETVQHPNTSGKLTSDDAMLELENDYCSDGHVCGTIKNLSNDSYSYVEVDINLYDASGNQVESTLANINNLEGNTSWNFKAPVINQDRVSKYKVVGIKESK
ncbi:hypothetical protein CLRAG_33780 [Clostridium ragsdalei P11]|uniref:Uncharacterized protein n=1 Tax=Clostridium ragsdalei P11 TaxID=1353534 RepID=A0A1A6AKW9_9CLOT|nr:FxLYD domain-containing protein [Clostridium ragsdalei]OBR90730.1 hypothetical protein CLRAG_33780 [Clostridium ragsdalei P11]